MTGMFEMEAHEAEEAARLESGIDSAVAMLEASGTGSAADEAPVEYAHGFKLHLSDRSTTGYKGVYKSGKNAFFVQVNKPHVFRLGTYKCAVEAAVAYAKYHEPAQEESDITADLSDLSGDDINIFDGVDTPEVASPADTDEPRRIRSKRKRDALTDGTMTYGGWEALLNGH